MVARIERLFIQENQPSYVEGLLIVEGATGETVDSFKFLKYRANPSGTTIDDAFKWANKEYGVTVAIGPESKMYYNFLKVLGYKKFIDSETNKEYIL